MLKIFKIIFHSVLKYRNKILPSSEKISMDFNLVDQFNRLLSHVIPGANIVQLTNKIM